MVLALAGCGGSQLFEATGHATGVSPQGLAAAEYDLWGPYGNTGEARVWSTGAYDGAVDGTPATIIHVVIDLQNNGETPMTLTDLRLESAEVDGLRLRDLPPVRVDGSNVVTPGGESRVDAYFAVSNHIDPDDLSGFRVRWNVQQGQRSYAQRTPFMQAPRYALEPYPYIYAPVLYGIPPQPGHPVVDRSGRDGDRAGAVRTS
jgi:hypothetical protein